MVLKDEFCGRKVTIIDGDDCFGRVWVNRYLSKQTVAGVVYVKGVARVGYCDIVAIVVCVFDCYKSVADGVDDTVVIVTVLRPPSMVFYQQYARGDVDGCCRGGGCSSMCCSTIDNP